MGTFRGLRETRVYPIAAGALVGLASGVLGLAIAPEGGMIGAVGGGATAAYLSDEEVPGEVLNAAIADVSSSVVFFLLVLVGFLAEYLVYLSGKSGVVVGALGTLYVSLYAFVFGTAVAVPIAGISLAIAAISGTVTSLAKRTVG